MAFFTSCSSIPKEIPEDLTAQELIQKGQNEFENGRYKASFCYYNAVTERFMDNPAVYAEATYEIGHLFMKQKNMTRQKLFFGICWIYTLPPNQEPFQAHTENFPNSKWKKFRQKNNKDV